MNQCIQQKSQCSLQSKIITSIYLTAEVKFKPQFYSDCHYKLLHYLYTVLLTETDQLSPISSWPSEIIQFCLTLITLIGLQEKNNNYLCDLLVFIDS